MPQNNRTMKFQIPEEIFLKLETLAKRKQKQTARYAASVVASHVKMHDETPVPTLQSKPVGELLDKLPKLRAQDIGLKREEVDPDFNGTSTEFLAKYGHVNLHTKTELEKREAIKRAEKLSVAMRHFIGGVDLTLTIDDIETWIKADPSYRRLKLMGRASNFFDVINKLMPLLIKATETPQEEESLAHVVKDSYTGADEDGPEG